VQKVQVQGMVMLIFRIGQIRMLGFQVPYIRMPPAPSLCGMLLCWPWRVHYSQQLSTNPSPLYALQLAYQPLHPICNFFDNHWLQPTPKRLWLRIAQKNTARIRRIYGNTLYIAVYTPYKYVHTEIRNSDTAGGGWKIRRIYRTVEYV
jgi:hypothetical protein